MSALLREYVTLKQRIAQMVAVFSADRREAAHRTFRHKAEAFHQPERVRIFRQDIGFHAMEAVEKENFWDQEAQCFRHIAMPRKIPVQTVAETAAGTGGRGKLDMRERCGSER